MTAYRFQWATYNTWGHDRRKARKASRKAWRDLAQLIQAAPAALAAAHDRRIAMNEHYWSDEAMEARQEARRRIVSRCGNPAPRPAVVKPPTQRERLLADGFVYTVLDQDKAAHNAEQRERQRQADEARTRDERLFNTLRDLWGPEAAQDWMRGGDDAA